MIYVGFPSCFCFGIREQLYSNFVASAVSTNFDRPLFCGASIPSISTKEMKARILLAELDHSIPILLCYARAYSSSKTERESSAAVLIEASTLHEWGCKSQRVKVARYLRFLVPKAILFMDFGDYLSLLPSTTVALRMLL